MDKKLLFIVIFITICLAFVLTNKDNNEEKVLASLIVHKEKIDLLWISTGNSSAKDIKDMEFISKLIKDTEDIGVEKLSIKKEMDIMPKFLNENQDTIILIDFHQYFGGEPAYGRMLLNDDGTIIAVDTTTDLSTKRSVSYLAINKYPELYQSVYNTFQAKEK